MKALSSTTRTRFLEDTGSFPHGPYFDASVGDMEVHAAAVVAADVFADDLDLSLGEDVAYRGDVALADVDPARGRQVAEHARPADDLGADAPGNRPELLHLREDQGYDGSRKLRRIRPISRHRFAREQHVRQP